MVHLVEGETEPRKKGALVSTSPRIYTCVHYTGAKCTGAGCAFFRVDNGPAAAAGAAALVRVAGGG